MAALAALNGVDPTADYVTFPMDGVCTVDVDCTEGISLDAAPAVGTFSVKSRSVTKLSKVIPAKLNVIL